MEVRERNKKSPVLSQSLSLNGKGLILLCGICRIHRQSHREWIICVGESIKEGGEEHNGNVDTETAHNCQCRRHAAQKLTTAQHNGERYTAGEDETRNPSPKVCTAVSAGVVNVRKPRLEVIANGSVCEQVRNMGKGKDKAIDYWHPRPIKRRS